MSGVIIDPQITHSLATVVWPHAAFKDIPSHSQEHAATSGAFDVDPMIVNKALYVWNVYMEMSSS